MICILIANNKRNKIQGINCKIQNTGDPCERLNVQSQRRQDKFEANQKTKRKQKKQRPGIHELPNKSGMGSDAHEG